MRAALYAPDLTMLGYLPTLSGTVVLRRNQVSTFALEVNADHHGWGRFRKGQRVVISDDTGQLLAGPIRGLSHEYAGGARTVTVSGVCDLAEVQGRVTYPNPAQIASEQSDGYYKRSGNAGRLITDLVRLNAGQGALSARRALTVEVDDMGPQRSINTRFKPLLDETLALAGQEVTYRTWQDDQIRFGLYAQRDLTRHVRLSPESGTVTGYTLEDDAPEVTQVYVAGQGEGAARTIRIVSGNASEWGVRVEEFRDRRDTDDPTELQQAGEERIAEGAAKQSVNLTLADHPRRRFGQHFQLGDTITVNLGADGIIQDIVQSAEITFGESGREVKLQVGPTLEDLDSPRWVSHYRDLRRDIRALQTR